MRRADCPAIAQAVDELDLCSANKRVPVMADLRSRRLPVLAVDAGHGEHRRYTGCTRSCAATC